MNEVHSSGASGLDLAHLSFGMQVRYARLCIKMSAEQLGILYAQAIGRAQPYTGRRIEQMERTDDFPQDETRRWAIAKIVQLGLFFQLSSPGIDVSLPEVHQNEAQTAATRLQIKNMNFDLNGHQTFLKEVWTQGIAGTLEELENETFNRIKDIYTKTSYLSDPQKKQAWRTLCGLHIMLASDVYGAQNDLHNMTKQTRLAALLARENHFPDLYAIAILQRGVFLMDQGSYSAALDDFLTAKRVKNIPQQLRGKILVSTGRAKARLAKTQEDKDQALTFFDEAESTIEKSSLDDFNFLVALNKMKYLLERGEALIGSPLKQLRSPETALSYLPIACRACDVSEEDFMTVGHRQAHNHILQAEIAIDQGQYPIATTLAEEALIYAERLQSGVHPKKLVKICTMLKQSPYGDSREVTMLEIGVIRNLRPELFC